MDYEYSKCLGAHLAKIRKDNHLTQEQLSNEAERIRADCAVIRSFFAAVLGEATTDSLFREIPDNRRMYLDIFEEFLAFVYRQTLAAAQRMTTIIQQYAPRDSNESAV